jgi:uncharacterized membrane protein
MRLVQPRLGAPRRAGLLAAVAVYPLSRLAGTLPRPTLDRALVSGTSMAVAFQSAAAITGAVRRSSGLGSPSPRTRALRASASAGTLTLGAAVVASRARGEAGRLAAAGDRLPVPAAAAGAIAELLTVAAGAGALVTMADAVGLGLPDAVRPTRPVVVLGGVTLVGAALGAVARHPRVLEHLTLPAPAGTSAAVPRFQTGASLPIAVGRSVLVAVATVAGLALETNSADWIARGLSGDPQPGGLARVTGHAVILGGLFGAGVAGLGFYSSRVEVQERILEAAYAAVPNRRGVTGGPTSGYEFTDLGREGRRFVSQAHTADELETVLGTPAVAPVRAWLPYSALTFDDVQDGAALVAEIERLGGFARNVIVLSAPTGDGYVSYVHTESVEMLTAGDSTTAAVPYANVPSALAMPKRARAATSYAVYARAVAERARELNPQARLFTFGESLGSIVALDAFGPDLTDELSQIGFDGGLYCGVPVYSRTDRVLRPRDPGTRSRRGLQYATGRDQALHAAPGHLNLTHPTDPVAVADPSTLVRHAVDYWGRPFGVHVPLVSFLVHLVDVKNAMNLRPGDFQTSPGHDYRYDTAAAVARAYGLPFDREDVVEAALRERELAWSVRRLLSRRIEGARDSALTKMQSWGVDPATVATRFRIPERALPTWLQNDAEDDYT